MSRIDINGNSSVNFTHSRYDTAKRILEIVNDNRIIYFYDIENSDIGIDSDIFISSF